MRVRCIDPAVDSFGNKLELNQVYEAIISGTNMYRINGHDWFSHRFVVVDVAISTVNSSGETANDHICPTCKNNRVSLIEKQKKIQCWKCGNQL